MKKRFLLVLVLLWSAPLAGLAQGPTGAVAQVDARVEVAAALYAASATQAAADRVADSKMRAQHIEIERLRTQVRVGAAGAAQLQAALTAAEETYVANLAARDRAYAQEITVFRAAVQDIAATPEGAAALARFNAGDEIGALAILDNLRMARDAARKKRADIESAAEGRRIATLALEARVRGKLTTAQVIARYEEVTRLDPGLHWDWVELSRLYRDAGTLPEARRAAERAANAATDDGGRAVTALELGDVLVAQGNGAGALAAYRKYLTIAEALAASEPANTEWQRALSVSFNKIGDALVTLGDRSAALAAYRKGIGFAEALAASDRDNTEWQRDLSLSHKRIGDELLARGDEPGALAAYRKGLGIDEALAAVNRDNTEWQHDLSVTYGRIGDVLQAQGYGAEALAAYRKGLGIAEALAAVDPTNTEWQRALSIIDDRIGDELRAQGDGPGALAEYRQGIVIAEALATRDPANAEWQRDLIVSLVNLSQVTGDKAYAAQALDRALAMQKRGILAPSDSWMIENLKRRAGR
jgi:tetratricopeptide (TPR) repeat protein